MELIIGIDFGTTNTIVSFYKNDAKIFSDGIFDKIPTQIHFGDTISCGNYIPVNLQDKDRKILTNFKNKIGKIETFEGYDENKILILFFNHLFKILNKKFNNYNFKTVLTVPSNFNDNQRKILMNTASNVGFEIIRIINEPTAAAFAYGIDTNREEEKILVFDLGGGTLDITVLEIDDNFFETIDSIGLNNLGGNNFTKNIYENAIEEFKNKYYYEDLIKVEKDKLTILWNKANTAKEKLIWKDNVSFEIKNFYKKKIEKLLSNFEDNFSEIIMVGGASKLFLIQDIIERKFKKKPMIHHNLQQVVALGACQYGAYLENKLKVDNDIILVDNLPLSLGIETADGTFSIVIPKNTPLPAYRTQKYTTDTPGDNDVVVKVYQGERTIANKNYLIGEFNFDKVSKVTNPIINISFKVDINGIISIYIQDKYSGRSQNILIRNIKKDIDVDKIIQDAKINNDEDEHNIKLAQLIYKLQIKIENILSNLKVNNLIEEKDKKEKTNYLLSEYDIIKEKDIAELLLLDQKLDNNYLMCQQNVEDFEKENNNLDIEKEIVKEKKEYLKEKVEFYLLKNLSNFERENLNNIKEEIETNILFTEEDLDEKLLFINKLFVNNPKDELFNLCMFLKEELEQKNLGLNERQNYILKVIVNKYLNLIENSYNLDYNIEINKLNDLCKKMVK
jgi:molecular chaperone DnaK